MFDRQREIGAGIHRVSGAKVGFGSIGRRSVFSGVRSIMSLWLRSLVIEVEGIGASVAGMFSPRGGVDGHRRWYRSRTASACLSGCIFVVG